MSKIKTVLINDRPFDEKACLFYRTSFGWRDGYEALKKSKTKYWRPIPEPPKP